MADRFWVVVSGTTHQGDNVLFPEGRNSQCMAISTCAAAWGALGKEFSQAIIDDLLRIGTEMYVAVRGDEPFLEPEDLPLQAVIRNERVNIAHTQLYYNHFPIQQCDMLNSCQVLAEKLGNIFVELPDMSSLLFTGQHYTVTFWQFGNLFYLFNSHGVNPSGVYDLRDEAQNVSRLFCCENVISLATLLLSHSACDGQKRYYCIYQMSFVRVMPTDIVQETGVTTDQVQDASYNHESINQTVLLNKRSAAETSKPSSGRPKKRKLGRPANPVSQDRGVVDARYRESHREVYTNASRRYQSVNPETNRKTSKMYQSSHPETNRETSKRYQSSHPETNRETSRHYRETHTEMHRQASQQYYEAHSSDIIINRNLPVSLRNRGLIGQFNGELLKEISFYKLKNPSLLNQNCFKCAFCNASLFEEEKDRKMWCCGQGRYNVLNLPSISNASFYEDDTFRKHMRFYNDTFAFSALVIPQGWHHPRTGLSFVKILGKVYHKVYDLSYSDTRFRNHSTLYIDDGQARAVMAAQDDRLDQRILDAIDSYLRNEAANPYIRLFKKLADEPSDSAHIVFENTTRRTHGPNIGEQPSTSEVAAIINTEGAVYQPRTIAIWKVGQAKAHTVDVFHPLYEPFGYPLLYPHGTPGWHIGRPDNLGGKGLTLERYVRCLLLSEPRFRDLDRLSETWLVDMYSRIEEQRLRFIEFSQKRSSEGVTRIAPFDEVRSAANIERGVRTEIQADETVQGDGGAQAGRVYLPNTFTGGPRYMKTKYLDAMAVVAKKGGPTYFLTMTTNAEWPEIVESRRPGSKSQPDICSRVFYIKKQELLRDLRGGKFFGKPSYIMHVLEEQKRGLMHVHVLFKILGHEPQQGEEIDAFIRADIPGVDEADGRLREIVLKHMIHGPCGPQYNRTELPCWNKTLGTCEKRFPKPCPDSTYVDDHGFVFYKRNSNNKAVRFYRRKPVEISDSWVVSYNAALLLKYDCHINLELASQSKVVKYMFNYITKGVPLANIAVVDEDEEVNEVEKYKTQRYLSSSFCSWRVLEFNITGLEPSVSLLPVHLENKQSVLFKPGSEGDAINRTSSLLLLYFDRPHLPEMEELTYTSFYEQYMVESKRPGPNCRVTVHDHPDGRHFVYKRQRNEKICRMFWVAPNRGEQFYLRLLLNIYPCRGYGDLISKGGTESSSFQQTAINLGHANDLDEFRVAMEEARVFMKGKRLRSFFVMLCNVGAPAAVLWEEFKYYLIEDFAVHFPIERCYSLALTDIDRNLRRQGSSNEEQGLPVVDDGSTELDRERLAHNVTSQAEFVEEWLPRLSTEQRFFFDTVDDVVNQPISAQSKTLYLDGPGGYGKTLLLQVITAHIRSKGGVVLCVASSGIAALNLAGGSTAHSMFRLPLSLGSGTGYWSLSNSSERAQLIREAKLIIYDEVSMCHRYLVEMLDRSLRDLLSRHNQPFGGKSIIFSGDFRQCAPVVTGSRCSDDIVSSSVRSSYVWQTVDTYHLTQPQRTAGDEGYSRFLLNVGDGNENVINIGEENLIQQLISIAQVPTVTTLEDLVNFVYPPDVLDDADMCARRAILCTLNANVNEVNEMVLQSISGEVHTLYSVDYVETDGGDQHQHLEPEHLHQVTAQGVPPHQLRLKVGSVCLVTRNLNISDGIVNGTKVVVVAITPRLIRVRKPGQYGNDSEFAIPRIIFKFPVGKNKLLEMCRRQFPLMLCYAMSVHKSQGQTIDLVGVDLRTDVFSHGQLYVALSRVRSAEHIRVLVPPHRVIDGVPYVRNIVYKELL